MLLDDVRPRAEALAAETLAVDVVVGAPPAEGAHVRELSIDGEPLTLGLSPA